MLARGSKSPQNFADVPYGRSQKEIDARDEFLSTPLHYAAFRGAAVCCLLLLERNSIEYQQTDSSHSKEFLVYRVSHKAVNF